MQHLKLCAAGFSLCEALTDFVASACCSPALYIGSSTCQAREARGRVEAQVILDARRNKQEREREIDR